MTPGRVRQHINALIRHLQLVGLVDDYQEAFERQTKFTEISFSNAKYITNAFRNIDYPEIYSMFAQHRVFNARLLDGAFIQMLYLFEENELIKHRLAFLPPPDSVYYNGNIGSEGSASELTNVIEGNRIGQPLRFDYNFSNEVHIDVNHPKSHLTIGDYANCRIPVSAALTPYWFLYFILQNFYSRPNSDFLSSLPRLTGRFPVSIANKEKTVPHLVVPQ